MEFHMLKQMCWLSTFASNGQMILHLRTDPYQPWRTYTAFPQYAVPDYPIPGGSKGWATCQKLLQEGWSLEKSNQSHKSALAGMTRVGK
jgi:hypothetical protein